jgi:hypothetical protein
MLQQLATFRKNIVFDAMLWFLCGWVFVAPILARTVVGFAWSMLSAMAAVGVVMVTVSLFARAILAFRVRHNKP